MINLLVVVETLLMGAAMVGALFYFGFGVTLLVAPRAWRSSLLLLMPFAGMALLIVWDYGALALNFNLTVATWALVVATGILNVVGWRRERLVGDTSAQEGWRGTRWVLVLVLVAFCAAVAPLWRYGYLTIIGENWDYEFYLPLADYLRVLPTSMLASAPSNPLLNIILSRHILPLPMGFSYLQASLDTLLNLQALDTFAVLMGMLRALGVLGAFLFFRTAFKMSERAAVVATGFVALNGLLLWFTYWNFGLHLAALALMPVALTCGIYALQTRNDWRGIVCAGFFLGALNVTYHPALIAAGLPLVVLGLYSLVTQKDRIRVLQIGIAVMVLTVLFSLPTLWHIEDFRREYYGREPLAIGLREFVPPSDGYGLSLNTLDLAVGHTIPTPWLYDALARVWAVAAPVLTILAIGMSLYALWKLRGDTERRAVWYSVVGASVFYVLIFRLPFLRPYPYGFLKSLSLVVYVLVAVAVEGAERFWISDFRFSILRPKLVRYGVAIFGAVVGIIIALTFLLSMEQYFKPAPPFFDADALQVRAAGTYLENHPLASGDKPTVFLTDRAEAQKIPMGLAAYALLGNELNGKVTTGYGALDNVKTNAVYDYALLARGEEPTLRGYQANALWANNTFALYARGAGVLLHQNVNETHETSQPFDLTLDINGLPPKNAMVDHTPAERALTVAFVAFSPKTLTLRVGDENATLELQPGLTRYTFPRVALPTTLTVGATGELYVVYLELREPSSTMQGSEFSNAMTVRCQGNKDDLGARCRVANPQGRAVEWRWIVRGTLEGTREERVIAEGSASGAPRTSVRIEVGDRENLQGIRMDNDALVPIALPRLPAGNFRAAVEVWDGSILLARFDVHALLRVEGNGMTFREQEPFPVVIPAP